jgi:rRNA small subunit pseudouridine methyltransferase Nep1
LLRLVLADAELELIPPELTGHAAVQSYARRRGKPAPKLLLDSSFVHAALRGVPEGGRRGRPDIVHVFLLVCLDSILNLHGGLQVVIHTRNDEVIHVSPETRLPKNYNRFVGLVESLFEKGAVPSEETPLLRLERETPLAKLIETLKGPIIALSEDAEIVDPLKVFQETGADVTCIVGGFPHGDFRSPVNKLAHRRISLSSTPLKIWTVASELITAYERFTGILDGVT